MPSKETERELIDVATSLESAAIAFKQGKYGDAEPIYRRALDVLEREYGPADPDAVACLQSLGDICYQMGRYKDAMPLYKRLLTIGEQVLGKTHPSVIDMVLRLATTYQQLGMNDDAETLFRRANQMSQTMMALKPDAMPKAQGFTQKQASAPPEPMHTNAERERAKEIFTEHLDMDEIKKGWRNLASTEERKTEFYRSRRGAQGEKKINPVVDAFITIRGYSAMIMSVAALMALCVFAYVVFTKLSLATPRISQIGHLKGAAFKSSDGFIDLVISPKGEPTYKLGGKTVVSTVTAMGPDLMDFKDSILSSLLNKEVWFEETTTGLKREDGTILYSKNGPEMTVIRQLEEIRKNATTWFAQLRKYPSERGQVVLSASPLNAVSGRPEIPSVDKVENQSTDLREVTEQPVVTQPLDQLFEATETAHWLKESPGYPGGIHCLSVVHKLPQGDSREFFAHGFDRNGLMIAGGKPHTVYLVAFHNGGSPFPQMEKIREGRPIKLCIVRLPKDTPLWMIRYFMPLFCGVFAVLFLLGSRLGRAKGESGPDTMTTGTRMALVFGVIASLWVISYFIP